MADHQLPNRSAVEEKASDPPPYSPGAADSPGQAPPAFTSTAQSPPGPALTALDFTTSELELPKRGQCIAHLKLLHAFHKLRNDVGNREGLYGIHLNEDKAEAQISESLQQTHLEGDQTGEAHAPAGPSTNSVHETPTANSEKLREKRWTIFVNKAVERYTRWGAALPSSPALTKNDFDRSVSYYNPSPASFPLDAKALSSEFALPPLDVLMVWHSHMLNPRAYLEDCMRLNKKTLYGTPFPWEAVFTAIDDHTFTYNPDEAAKEKWQERIKRPWDPLEDEQLKELACPKCEKILSLPWSQPPTDPMDAGKFELYLETDTGYASPHFQLECDSCHLQITHENLRVGKFLCDGMKLLTDKMPMPGTILSMKGIPQIVDYKKGLGTHDLFFPNRIIEKIWDFSPKTLRKEIDSLTMEKIKFRIEDIMRQKYKRELVNSSQFKPDFLAKDSKFAVRSMLSHYWDNSSPFALDLVGAVMRQGGFIQKMVKIDWLHSPAVAATCQRLIIKYHRFVRLIADNPKKQAVPTLDVDLAWHTHQLSPKSYYSYTKSETGKFLNHDDKIPSVDLSTSFRWTSNAYEKKYGQPYSECACWYCECVREPMRSAFTNKVFRPGKLSKLDEDAKDLPKDPIYGPHLSTHNAVSVPNSSWASAQRRENQLLDEQYAKVCKRYKKKKKDETPPSKDDSDVYIYSAYGYPLLVPYYIPYYPAPSCDGDHHNTAGGGGCAAGTCGGYATMGGCCDGSAGAGGGCKASCGGHGNADGGCGTCGGGDGGGDGGGGDGGGCGGCGG